MVSQKMFFVRMRYSSNK